MLFNWIFGINLVLSMVIRTVFGIPARKNVVEEKRAESGLLKLFLAGWGIGMLLPLVYIVSDWLAFGDIALPEWLRWFGAALFTLGNLLLWRSHADLGLNWSETLAVRDGHQLVTDGVYRHIRRPMYSAHFLIAFGVLLLIPNWTATVWLPLSIAGIYALRVPDEEAMMVDRFGAAYEKYRARTGGLLPKIG